MFNKFFVRAVLLCGLAAQSQGLWAGESLLNMLGDRKAIKVGDVLMVQVLENSAASQSADTTTKKSGGFGLSLKFPNTNKDASADVDTNFSGQGKIVRSGRVLAQLSAVVNSIDERGMLDIAAHQVIEVNGEKQEIELSGKVRPSDITDGNTILSSRIADARIRYVGDGILAEQQRPGVLTRFLSWLGIL